MSDIMSARLATDEMTRANARITVYPDGTVDDAVVASHYIYRRPGWVRRDPVDVLPRLSGAGVIDAIHDRPIRALRRDRHQAEPGRSAAAGREQNQERGAADAPKSGCASISALTHSWIHLSR